MNLSQIRREATELLRKDGDGFRKSVLIHTAVTIGLSLLLILITQLSQHLAPAGGLYTTDALIFWETGQALLLLARIIIVPFWEAGLVFCALRLLRGRDRSPVHLTEGFRRWGGIVSSMLIRGMIYFFAIFTCSMVSSLVMYMLPMSSSLLEELNAFLEAPTLPLTGGVRMFMAVYMIVYITNLCVLLIPKLYLHRLVSYQIMDDEPCGGLQGVLNSGILMRGQRRNLLLLDLSFWWFYLLALGISALSMAHLILPGLAEAIPYANWIFPIIALLARFALYYFGKPKLAVAYALFYQQVLDGHQKEPEPAQPKRMPWKY